jgi:hypothetical protein
MGFVCRCCRGCASECISINGSIHFIQQIEYSIYDNRKGLLQNEDFAAAPFECKKKANDWLYEPVIGII